MQTKIALFGGVYNNYLALEAAIADAQERGATEFYCLGDLGAFGPFPDRVFDLLKANNVQTVQGNYDDSIGHELEDCQCGYTDPRDNYFAAISYEYTLKNTSDENKKWLRERPKEIRIERNGYSILLCHGSPRKTNEFLWESTTSTAFLDRLVRAENVDLIAATHTGLHWERRLSQHRQFVNVGVLGRPENDGTTNVWYTLLSIPDHAQKEPIQIEFFPVHYDFQRLAKEMQLEGIAPEFIETILSGWWTTCLEILPSKERRAGKF